MAQLLAALQGGCVAGETLRQIATRLAAAADPISAAQDSGALLAIAVAGVRSGIGLCAALGFGDASVGGAAASFVATTSALRACSDGWPHPPSAISALPDMIHDHDALRILISSGGLPRLMPAAWRISIAAY